MRVLMRVVMRVVMRAWGVFPHGRDRPRDQPGIAIRP